MRTSSRMRRMPSVKRYERSTASSRSAARAASTTACVSAAVRPSGFWQNTAAPRSSARMDCSACRALGVAMTTPSTSGIEEVVEACDERRAPARACPPPLPHPATGRRWPRPRRRRSRRSPACGGGRSSRCRGSPTRGRASEAAPAAPASGVVMQGHQRLEEAVRAVARRVERFAEPVERKVCV